MPATATKSRTSSNLVATIFLTYSILSVFLVSTSASASFDGTTVSDGFSTPTPAPTPPLPTASSQEEASPARRPIEVIVITRNVSEGLSCNSSITKCVLDKLRNRAVDKIEQMFLSFDDDLCTVFQDTLNMEEYKNKSIIAIDEERVEGRETTCPYISFLQAPTALQLLHSGYSTQPYVTAYLTSPAGKVTLDIFWDRFGGASQGLVDVFLNDAGSDVADPLTPPSKYVVSDYEIKNVARGIQEMMEAHGTPISNTQCLFGWILILVGLMVGILTIDNKAFANFEVKELDVSVVKKDE